MNQLLSNNQVLIDALNYTRAGVLITDPSLEDNPIVYANKGFTELTGYHFEEIIGKNCRFLQGEKTDQAAIEKIRTAIQKKESIFSEVVNYKKDGSLFWNSLSIDPLYLEEEGRHYFVGVQHDVTKRKDVEADYLKSVEEVKSLACPIVPLINDIAVLPLFGEMSDKRFETIFNKASDYIIQMKTTTLVIDLSGLTTLTGFELDGILKLKAVLSLVGAKIVISGMSSDMALKAVQLDEQFISDVKVSSSLKSLLEELI